MMETGRAILYMENKLLDSWSAYREIYADAV